MPRPESSPTIEFEREIPWLVSEYEEREAAASASIPWPTYAALPLDERAYVVAHYRVNLLLAAHRADEARRNARKRSS